MADTVRISGLADLRRDLRAIGAKSAGRGLTKALRAGAEEVAVAARPRAPHRTGALAASYRAGAAGKNAYVRSRLPYAAVHEFGGTISPKGSPITIRASGAVTGALRDKEDAIVDRVADAIDKLAVQHGWH